MYVWKTWLLLQFCDERNASSSEEVAKVILKAMTSEDPKLSYTANDDDAANSDPWYYKQETACQI